jgi:hypothetical protein
MFLQPFVSYQATHTVTLTVQSETGNVPKDASVATIASYQFGFGVFAAHPDLGPSWKVRAAVVILLPRR